jgi:histidinol-phosphate aminotransferase
MIDIEKNIRQNIRNLKPYSSARDEFQGEEGIFLDANENPFGEYNRYPDPHQNKLKQEIAKIKQVKPSTIFFGNGSDEAIDIAFRIFCEPRQHKALLFTPTYGMYEVAAAINDIELLKVDLTDKFQIDLPKVKSLLQDENLKLIFICTPNNPTGNVFKKRDIDFILINFKGVVIIDEAYIDFSTSKSYIASLSQYNNLIVLQTFSKAWGLAGVRVGMAFSNETIINYFNKVKPPYNISGPNQQIVLQKLKEIKTYKKEVLEILKEKEKLCKAFMHLKLVRKVYPSDANFLLIEVENADSVYNTLVAENIIVRNRTKIINNCLRITIGTKKENQQLITALKQMNDE